MTDTTDPWFILAAACVTWAAWAWVEARLARRRNSADAPRENRWRNRWH